MKLIYYSIVITILMCSSVGNLINPMTRESSRTEELLFNSLLDKAPPCLQLYYYTKYYCEIYNVPERIGFRVLRQETNYKGPTHFTYNPAQTSLANALGPWQVLFSTAKDMHDDPFPLTKNLLLNDIQLNTKLGVKYLAYLYNQPKAYNDWERVTGFYNTGHWKINDYAKYTAS